MLINNFITLTWSKRIKKYYENLGYTFTNYGDQFIVSMKDLSNGSNVKFKIKCDICECVNTVQISQLSDKIGFTYTCNKCIGRIQGTKNRRSDDDVRDIVESNGCTFIDTFTLNYALHVNYICECGNKDTKRVDCFIRGYRCNICRYEKMASALRHEYSFVKQYFEDHGCTLLSKTYKSTFEKLKYVCECGRTSYINFHNFQNGSRCRRCSYIKGNQTKYENGVVVASSKQQRHLHGLCGGILNYPVDMYNLDIAFPNEKIYIEYDGGGHNLCVKLGRKTEEEFRKGELSRYYILKRKGWKYIRVNCPTDVLPTDEIMTLLIQYARDLIQDGRNWCEIDLLNETIICKDFNSQFKYLLK